MVHVHSTRISGNSVIFLLTHGRVMLHSLAALVLAAASSSKSNPCLSIGLSLFLGRYLVEFSLKFHEIFTILTNETSTLFQVMTWCHQAPSHYLSQCWPRSMSLIGLTRPQCILISGNIKMFCICQAWDGIGSWNPSPWKTRACHSSCIINTMVAEVLVTSGARGLIWYCIRHLIVRYPKVTRHGIGC